MKTPVVSVIIPTYNRAYILFKAIESVLNQTFKNLEIIVVDDGSTDQTPKLITRYPVVYVKKPRKGVAHARNRGLFHAKGRYIAFLDSDDMFTPTKLEEQLLFFEKHPSYKIVQTDEIWYKGEKRLNPKKIHKKAEGWFFERAVKLCVVSMSTVLIKKELFEEIGVFDEEFWVCEDYEFWLRVAIKTPVGLIPKPLVIKSGGREDQLSATKGLDYYRTLALIKLFKNYQKELSLEQKLILFGEAKNKFNIFYRGALKHGNLNQAFNLKKLFEETFKESVFSPLKSLPKL
ncbi:MULTISPECIES: glycosyltransferase [Thermodesulfobacterium]|jgi:glycosyltransferase involved in cell wall biosynthesis|uniref:Glycosyl transferase n=2 Tax=Thermodesulfobacterium commune TaxID=1741 RepID=A0A075WSZ6_9BACT|nr:MULTISPECIES: glycosyltransferase [Thermodesulfobacterium]KUJ97927.1 MAG: Glycosyl transferase family 2 [Thermodesulfobacterium sp. 37_54]KUK19519.1 MAG: Glycosyl transferase family 2 [Thermodesulfobacterium commune]AIH04115.1 glycosyl transferase [Thermodesulfobacterium commune DSM 2178]KUK37923.1 MAG: Glycosyl transferase family 2 [Thermodesulfobacterium commune]MBZ4682192.1 glycosyl transferase [Thermodesulfobacterium sp.]